MKLGFNLYFKTLSMAFHTQVWQGLQQTEEKEPGTPRTQVRTLQEQNRLPGWFGELGVVALITVRVETQKCYLFKGLFKDLFVWEQLNQSDTNKNLFSLYIPPLKWLIHHDRLLPILGQTLGRTVQPKEIGRWGIHACNPEVAPEQIGCHNQ